MANGWLTDCLMPGDQLPIGAEQRVTDRWWVGWRAVLADRPANGAWWLGTQLPHRAEEATSAI